MSDDQKIKHTILADTPPTEAEIAAIRDMAEKLAYAANGDIMTAFAYAVMVLVRMKIELNVRVVKDTEPPEGMLS